MATAYITPDNDMIMAEIFIAAPPARVFEAIADPKQRAQWWGVKEPSTAGPHEVVPFRVIDGKSDLRIGGRWSNDGIRGDGQRFHLEGEYLEIDPPGFSCIHAPPTSWEISRRLFVGSWSHAKFKDCIPAVHIGWAQGRW